MSSLMDKLVSELPDVFNDKLIFEFYRSLDLESFDFPVQCATMQRIHHNPRDISEYGIALKLVKLRISCD